MIEGGPLAECIRKDLIRLGDVLAKKNEKFENRYNGLPGILRAPLRAITKIPGEDEIRDLTKILDIKATNFEIAVRIHETSNRLKTK